MDASCKVFFAQSNLPKKEELQGNFSQLATILPSEAKQALHEIGLYLAPINVLEAITPINAAEEKQKWLQAAPTEFTNPVFQYNTEALQALANLGNEMVGAAFRVSKPWLTDRSAKVWTVTDAVMEIAHQRVLEAQHEVAIAQAVLEHNATAVSENIGRLYGLPDQVTVDSARRYARLLNTREAYVYQRPLIPSEDLGRLEKLQFNSHQIQAAFAWAAEQCGFGHTRAIKLDQYAIAISVRDRSAAGAVVVIPQNRVCSGLKLLQLTAHEILCHWRDSENARFLAGNLRTANEMLNEGHAIHTEHQVELQLSGKTKRLTIPWRIIGIDLAKNGANFAQVARELYPMILAVEQDAQAALAETWKTCMRIFRGSTDTENNHCGYAFTKDRVYFEGVALANALSGTKRGYMLEFGALNVIDLTMLGTVLNLDAENLPYQHPHHLIMQLSEKLLRGDFAQRAV